MKNTFIVTVTLITRAAIQGGLDAEEAKRLLRYTDKTSAAIGAYLGFSSQSYFSRVFQNYVGCTPGEWRERISA